ncbi:MAG TPA: aspartate/glutamate racemase family protein [Sulfolobales archaeon]|nr:aspartate/glutamate racemase family protein [Sulfolobales archaeon]
MRREDIDPALAVLDKYPLSILSRVILVRGREIKIAYLVPGIGLNKDEISRRENIANVIVSPGTKVDILPPSTGPKSIENRVEEAFASTSHLPLVYRYSNDYDAFVIGCFGDPGLRAARELTRKPVVGPAEATLHLASQLADRFTIIAPTRTAVKLIEDVIAMHGFKDRVVSVRSIEVPVLKIARGGETVRKIAEDVLSIAEAEKSEALVLGCMSMGFALVDEVIRKETDIPVLNPVKVSLNTAEVLARLGLSHSPTTYPKADIDKLKHILT